MADLGLKGRAVNNKTILANTRQLDKMVARWLLSNDPIERKDISKQCESIIKDTKLIISTLPAGHFKETIKVFNQAEQYFKKTCR